MKYCLILYDIIKIKEEIQMKKFLALLLAAVMMLSLVACGNDEPVDDPVDDPASDSEVEVVTRPNRLIYGSTTEISGDIGPGAWWTNNATDKMIRDLIKDYYCIALHQGSIKYPDSTTESSVDWIGSISYNIYYESYI